MEEKYEYVTLSILGDNDVGISQIIQFFVNCCEEKGQYYRSHRDTTIATIRVNDMIVKLKINDVPKFNTIRDRNPDYMEAVPGLPYRCDAAMFVFSMSNVRSLESIRYYVHEVTGDFYDYNHLLLGNKSGGKDMVSVLRAKHFAESLMMEFTEVNSETGLNVNEVFESVIRKVLLSKVAKKTPTAQPHQQITSTKVKGENRRLLQQNLNKAKRQHGTIPVRFLKLFFTGSGAAGKTSFVNLLLKKKFNKDHHSTNVVQSNHAVSVTLAAFQGSSNKVRWVQLGSDIEISFLKSVLLPSKTAPSLPPVTESEKQPLSTKPSVHMSMPAQKQYKPPIQQDTSIVQWVASLFKKSVNVSNLSTFQNILDSSSKSTFVYQPGEVLNIITLLDTGGQPEYIHLLPTINIYPTVTFIVHDLSKSLDDQVLVEYSQHGKLMFTPYHLSYSNRNMIKLLMSSANDALERSPSAIPRLVRTEGKGSTSYICLVGTHADKVPLEVVTWAASDLSSLVDKTQCDAAVWQTEEGSVLFSVDNTTADSEHNEDPVANAIRSRVETLATEKEVYELPITWMLLELEIRQACTKNQKSYISFDDCVALARDTGLISDSKEVQSVLLYHHLLGVLIYFAEVPGLCNYVITDYQWWFDKLSSIICITFQQASMNRQAVQKLKYEGLFSKDLLQHIEWEDDIKEEYFLSLLVCMKIIAPILSEEKKEEYFIPYVLPTFTVQQTNLILPQYGQLLGQPLLVRFRSGILPRGMFCSLIVELLQHSPKRWHPHFSCDGVHHTFSNLITFSLPDGYSMSLFDKVSYLEVQIRHIDGNCQGPVHVKAYNYLVYALTEVCIHLNFDYERLQYGYLCECYKKTEDHIAVLPEKITAITRFAECSINSVFRMRLNFSHLMWFLCEPSDNDAEVSHHSADDLKEDSLPICIPDQPESDVTDPGSRPLLCDPK